VTLRLLEPIRHRLDKRFPAAADCFTDLAALFPTKFETFRRRSVSTR